MLVINTDPSDLRPAGVVVYNKELFVSDPVSSRIKVYNASTMAATPLRSFATSNPGLLDYDREGFLWMMDVVQKKLIRFSTGGTVQAQSITFPATVIPTSFCVDKVKDRILVTNNGEDQNVLIYSGIFDTPRQTATFGYTGGINSGTAGAMAPLKFCEPKMGRHRFRGQYFCRKHLADGRRLSGEIPCHRCVAMAAQWADFYRHRRNKSR